MIIDIITCYDYDFVTTFNIITISCCYHYLVSTGLKMFEVNRFRAEAPVWISQDRRKEAFLSGDAQRSLEVYGSIRGSLQGSIRGPITVLYGDLYLGLGLRFLRFCGSSQSPETRSPEHLLQRQSAGDPSFKFQSVASKATKAKTTTNPRMQPGQP